MHAAGYLCTCGTMIAFTDTQLRRRRRSSCCRETMASSQDQQPALMRTSVLVWKVVAVLLLNLFLIADLSCVEASGGEVDILRQQSNTLDHVDDGQHQEELDQQQQQTIQHHRRTQNYNEGCEAALSTPLDPTSGSYGNVFSVRTVPGGPPVLITSLDFYTDQTKELQYEVWTMAGPYTATATGATALGALERWTQISSGTINTEGPSRPTPIPENNFDAVEVEGNGSYRSFYVTLSTPDIRYRAGTGSSDFKLVDASTDELEIMEGVGVILYPLPTIMSNYMRPRNFLGRIHYTSADTCPPKPTARPTPRPVDGIPSESFQEPITTRVMYTFSLQHPANIGQETVMQTVDDAIRTGLEQMLTTVGTSLNSYADTDDLAIRGVISFPIQSEDPAPCTAGPDDICTDIAATASVTHLSSASKTDIRHAMLDSIAALTNYVPYPIVYTGNKSVQADMAISVVGVPKTKMDADQTDLFERVTLGFLSERLGEEYKMMDSNVFDQTVVATSTSSTIGEDIVLAGRRRKHAQSPDESRRTLRLVLSNDRSLQSSSVGTLDVSVRITGENRNPNTRDFEEKIEDTIDSNGAAFSRDLTEAAKNDPVVSKSSYFDDILEISSRPVNGVDTPPSPAPDIQAQNDTPPNDPGGSSNIGIIIGAAVGGVVAVAVAAFLYIKRVGSGKKRDKFNSQLNSIDIENVNTNKGYKGGNGGHTGTKFNASASMNKKATYDNGDTEVVGRRSSFGGGGGGGGGAYTSSYYLASKGRANPAQSKLMQNGGSAEPGAVAETRNSGLQSKMAYNGAVADKRDSRLDNKLAYNGAPRRGSGTAPRRGSGTAPRRSSGASSRQHGESLRQQQQHRRSQSGERYFMHVGEEDLHYR